jgi:hypothetical protein
LAAAARVSLVYADGACSAGSHFLPAMGSGSMLDNTDGPNLQVTAIGNNELIAAFLAE